MPGRRRSGRRAGGLDRTRDAAHVDAEVTPRAGTGGGNKYFEICQNLTYVIYPPHAGRAPGQPLVRDWRIGLTGIYRLLTRTSGSSPQCLVLLWPDGSLCATTLWNTKVGFRSDGLIL